MNKTLAFGWLCACSLAHALTLGPAELEKANWESRQLTAADINGDGRQDLAYINGIERSIDLLIQKPDAHLQPSKPRENLPPLALTRYERQRITTEAAPNAFVFGDFGGTGHIELAYTARKLGIVFMAQRQGRWVETHRLSDVQAQPFTHVMWAGPLAPGQPTSLLALTKGRLLVIQNYKIVASYGTTYEDSGYLSVSDINGDGRMDVSYDYEAPNGLGLRLQDTQGRLDEEILLTYASQTEKNFGNRGDHIYFFGGSTPFVEERKLERSSLQPDVRIYGTLNEKPAGLLADIDGSGQDSLILADAKSSELTLYRQKDGRWGQPERYPGLKGVEQMARLGSDQLVVFSPEERAVGIAQWAGQRIGFPRLVEWASGDEPVGLVSHQERVWVVVKTTKDWVLQELASDGTPGQKQKLEGLKRNPGSAVALAQKEGLLIAFFQPRDTASFYWLSSKGTLTSAPVSSALARANFTNIEASRIATAQLPGSPGESLIIAQRGTLRLYRWQAGQLVLADQVLPLNSEANLRLPWAQGSQLWAYDTKQNRWYSWTQDPAKALWRPERSVEGPGLDPEAVYPQPTGWLGLGRNAFYSLDPQSPGLTLTPVARWESQLKLDGYNWGSLESFDTDKKTPCAVLFSQQKRILEIVQLGDKPQSLLNFEVYRPDIHAQGRKGEDVEPRELLVADVTGDGKPDLVLLIHNKILIYPQT